MIVKMLKTFVVARSSQQDRLLEALRELGVVHLMPVEAEQAVAEESTLAAIDNLARATRLLALVKPADKTAKISALEAAEETLRIQRESVELKSRLISLHHQLGQLDIWGEVRLEDFAELRQAGINVQFLTVEKGDLSQISAELIHVVRELSGKRVLLAIASRDSEKASIPDNAQLLELPKQDCPSIRTEAAEIDARLKLISQRLAQLATLVDQMQTEQVVLSRHAEFTKAQRGGLAGENLFALQGWVPVDVAAELSSSLAKIGIDAAVQNSEPSEDEMPPTLIRYPRWTRPMKGLFDILGTLPGYRELDLTVFFMLALPLFTAMIIGDGGYGLVLLLVPLFMYRKAVPVIGKDKIHLLMIMGAMTLIWGLLSGNIFGLTPKGMIEAGGAAAAIGKSLNVLNVIGQGSQDDITRMLMKLSFIFGTVHLSLARLRQAMGLFPNLRAISHLGWLFFLWGMLGVVWYLFFDSQKTPPAPINPLTPWLLILGGVLAALFASPNRNPAKMIGMGLANFPLSAIGTFSDTISYIRLMAVGMSSTVIAQTFNGLGYSLAQEATWVAGGMVILLGHALNIALCAIAVLAHGVRLNMLEFSTNAGVQWSGYAYEPFAKTQVKES